MYIEREEIAGPDYQPFSPDIKKWASQSGSVYIGDQKITVQHPRLRGPEKEIAIKSYEKLKERERFSEELLNEICEELFGDMERRGLELTQEIIWITDGGKGIIKALRKRFGKKLIHQRCTIHKDKNIQRHLAKRYRKEAHRRFRTALEHNSYDDARQMLLDMEKWLRSINESAADSLMEAIEEILTVHKLKVPGLLRKTLHSTNPIESMFSIVRDAEGNIKRYRNGKMTQRWLASVLLYSEKRFRRIKGYASIPEVIKDIKTSNKNEKNDRKAA